MHFVRPGEVVGPGLGSRHALNPNFQSSPKLNLLEGRIEPSGCDTEEGLVRRDMVNAVMTLRENDMPILQGFDPTRQPEVGVRPFVELVGQADEDGQQKEESEQEVMTSNLFARRRHETPQHPEHHRKAHSKVIAVGLHEIVPRDGCRVDVVLAERSDEGFAEDGDGHRAPRVAAPMHKAAEEVRHEDACQGRGAVEHDFPRLDVPWRPCHPPFGSFWY